MSLNVYHSTFINPVSSKKIEVFENCFMVVTEEGKILKILKANEWKKFKQKYDYQLIDLKEYICLPGFYDMHFHWVQWRVSSKPKDTLLNWLNKYVFPQEKKFQNKSYSEREAKLFFQKLIKAGTMGGAVYGSVHDHTVDMGLKYAVGDFVFGHPLMTMNSPEFLKQSVAESKAQIKKYSSKFKDKYAITPRFAPSTDPKVMSFGAEMAKKHGAYVQTHLSETHEEIEWVLNLYQEMDSFKKIKSYSDIYHQCGLLGPKTFLAHGVHLGNHDLSVLKKSKANIIHCPTSNAPKNQKGLGSGLFDYKKVENNGIPWALGSDIGAGPYHSMFDVIRSFVFQNKKVGREVSFSKGFYHSTLMGAKLLGSDKTSGSLDQHKWANFLCLKVKPLTSSEKTLPVKKRAEIYLKNIINKGVNNRQRYESLVNYCFYQGKQYV